MRAGSLVILGAVFLSAFAGRAAVLAARSPEGAAPAAAEVCVNGAFADELVQQAERLQAAMAAQAETDRTRAVVLQHVNERIDAYEKAGEALDAAAATMAAGDHASAKKVAALYEKMKPDLAGGIVGGMDPSFAASLLLSMNSENASAILGALPPERAYAITVLMADAS
jgi:flagellar motility protein MotE (MotC chaperone)